MPSKQAHGCGKILIPTKQRIWVILHVEDDCHCAAAISISISISPMLVFWLSLAALLVCTAKAQGQLESAKLKIKQRAADYARDQVELASRCLILYHVSLKGPEDSPDVPENNLKMFVSAMEQHSPNSTLHGFYLFAVAGGESNPLREHLKFNYTDAVVLEGALSDLESHTQTVQVRYATCSTY
jgi:hypothetical protein